MQRFKSVENRGNYGLTKLCEMSDSETDFQKYLAIVIG